MLIRKLLIHELLIKQRGEEQVKKEEKRKAIALKASQEVSEEENNEGSSDDNNEIAMLTRNFNRFLKRKHPSRIRDFNQKYEGEGKKKTKEVTCYECKKPSHIRSECPKLKFKNKEAKDRKKPFKSTWDDKSKSEKGRGTR